MTRKSRQITLGAMIGALYLTLCHAQNLLLPESTSFAIQFRAAEALCVLAFFTPAAVSGLTVGCFLYNLTFAGALPLDMLIEIGGVKMYLTHGHMMASFLSLAYRAKEKGAKVALFGHTHEAMCEMMDGVMLLNPGSAGNYCRGGSARASVLEIDRGGLRVINICL